MLQQIEIDARRDDGEVVRRLTAKFIELCDCNGPQPCLYASLAREHAASCPYRQFIESEMPREAARLVRNR